MEKIRVLIADDHTIFREGLCSLLAGREDIAVIGEAANGREAVEKAELLHPHIVIIDISMPLLNGFEATAQIRRRCPGVKMLVLTMHENPEFVRTILRAGASGYLVKKSAARQLFHAIKAIHRGEAFFSPSVSKVLLEQMVDGDPEDVLREPRLTTREKEILQLVAEGYANREIARDLFLSVKTVEGHKNNIKKKLGIKDQVGMIKYALSKGISSIDKI